MEPCDYGVASGWICAGSRLIAMLVLPTLLDKALTDTGYDLVSAADDDWIEARVSGSSARVCVKAERGCVLLAVPEPASAQRIGLQAVDTAPPSGMADIGSVDGAMPLYEALRMLRALQTHPAPLLSARVEARLSAIPETERTGEVRQRIGQDVFREALLDLWQGRCAVTGLALPPALLRASHAKPWARANDSERLDPFNGLLLAVHLDAMFDTGLIAFDDVGQLLRSPHLDAAARDHFHLHGNLQLRSHTSGHLPYLRWHREHVYQGV